MFPKTFVLCENSLIAHSDARNLSPWKSLWHLSHSQGHRVSAPWVSPSLSFFPNPCASVYLPEKRLWPPPWPIPHWRCSSGGYTRCWGQPGTQRTDLVSNATSRLQTKTSMPEHNPPAETPRTSLRVVVWAPGTWFLSRTDQANTPFVRTSSLWLEVSGCCCNTNGQTHRLSPRLWIYWKWRGNFVMLTLQLGIEKKETKILELSSPRSWRTWSQIWSSWQRGFCTQLTYTSWFIFNCRLIHGKTSDSIWYFWQNPGATEANDNSPMTSMGPCFKAVFLASQYNSTSANCTDFWLLPKRDITNRRIFLVGSSNDRTEESLIQFSGHILLNTHSVAVRNTWFL